MATEDEQGTRPLLPTVSSWGGKWMLPLIQLSDSKQNIPLQAIGQ